MYFYNRGNAALMLGRRAAAVADLREALRLEKGFAQAQEVLERVEAEIEEEKIQEGRGKRGPTKVSPLPVQEGAGGGDEGEAGEAGEGERKDGEGAINPAHSVAQLVAQLLHWMRMNDGC